MNVVLPDFVFHGLWGMRYFAAMQDVSRDHGTQPLDDLMDRWGITSRQLVGVSEEQLTHKQVQKARKGRQLTLRMMQKLTRTLNDAIFLNLPEERREAFAPYLHKHLFNYAKGHDPEWSDPNTELMPE